MSKHILVVEDDSDILELIKYTLVREGFHVTTLMSGDGAVEKAVSVTPDLILLDLMLPGLDGFELCRLFKRNNDLEHIPVVMLTAKSEDADVVTGLELGADDYITKPFSPKVLTARIRTILRRKANGQRDSQGILKLHNITIDPGRHEVFVDEIPVHLTLTEFNILIHLMKRPGWVYSRKQIIDSIHGEDTIITDRSIDVQVAGLRKKLGDAGRYIETVRGLGYRLKE